MRKAGIVIAIVLTVICGGLGWTVYQWIGLGKELAEASITREQFDAQKEGTARSQVLAALPTPLGDVTDQELYPGDPGRQGAPAGASCVYYGISPLTGEGPDLWRFCFVDGALAEKSAVAIPAQQ
ncbi:hypothetical protein [Actinoplanes derwentensis]|uniref:Uncharacterized protein n=1 Tax=Actinoplanes derwentensis TaxID=113562 RepID=A0A1H2A8K9_9ACTN|nr:hypothetical protein [Actinoplanes derwentensis]GID88463.1 hypothetical protein Ade03nite_73870 [Actinoplanes derwentensis]SDT42213.1 hypothetical protein SAMN04489716_3721 [Actinoplanes derwentensis]